MDDAWRTHDVALRSEGEAVSQVHREWLLTNGTGAYAMGTLPGVNTRRYHGLLVATTHPPVGRVMALQQVLEQVVLRQPAATGKSAGKGDKPSPQKLEFSTLQFHGQGGGDVYAPAGHAMLRRFEKGTTARWTYEWGKVRFVRELVLHWKEQAATIRYELTTPPGAAGALRLSPMLTLRDFHSLCRKDGAIASKPGADRVTVRRGEVSLTLRCEGARFERGEDWWYNVFYPVEAERGQDSLEDLYIPGAFEVELNGSGRCSVAMTVALGDQPARAAEQGDDDRAVHLSPIAAQLTERTRGVPGINGDPNVARVLAIAADDFVVDRRMGGRDLSTVLAGYPWFADWGRDTFISLPGLMLCTGRYEEAKATLQAFSGAIRDGLVPNRFDDYDESAAHYNTVDASLWYVHAAIEYVKISGDRAAWDQWLAAACRSIIEAYLKGTRHGIRMAGDGLITAGSPQTQLTWMDAKCGDVVFTARPGKAVEINALWYNALMGMAEMEEGVQGSVTVHYGKLGDRIKRAFAKVFWDEELGYLRDHVYTDEAGNDHIDASLRPNQVLALSLPRSPLPRTKQKLALRAVTEKLLTPAGLRTLPEGHPAYHPHYGGDAFNRDKAYHQWTVWPWLIGPYAEAVLRVGEFDEASKKAAHAAISPLLDRLMGEGLGQLHEIHEAAEPHRPVGCIAQAWSVAELVRVLALLGVN